MQQLYRLLFSSSISTEWLWEELESKGFEILYSNENENNQEFFVYWNTDKSFPVCAEMINKESIVLPEIDWNAQWEMHGHNFHDGFVYVDLNLFGPCKEVIRLQAGPGFGDLSHPTTRIVLKLMSQQLAAENRFSVLDIGCGSGVLSIAAAAIGAQKVIGLDIDSTALEHARQNAKLNELDFKCDFCLPSEMIFPLSQMLIVMNMIQSEQQIAWASLSKLHDFLGYVVTSGIRIEEKEEYLKMTRQWGWSLQNESEEGGWLGFVFRSI